MLLWIKYIDGFKAVGNWFNKKPNYSIFGISKHVGIFMITCIFDVSWQVRFDQLDSSEKKGSDTITP